MSKNNYKDILFKNVNEEDVKKQFKKRDVREVAFKVRLKIASEMKKLEYKSDTLDALGAPTLEELENEFKITDDELASMLTF